MNKIFDYLKVIMYYFLFIIIYLLIISIFYYFEILSYKVINIITYIYILLISCISGLLISKKIKKRGYLNGFIIASIVSIFFSIITLISKNFTLSSLIYYMTIILSSMIGGIIGAQKN